MARSKHHKRKKHIKGASRETFFETLVPAALELPAGPQMRQQLQQGLETAVANAEQLRKRLARLWLLGVLGAETATLQARPYAKRARTGWDQLVATAGPAALQAGRQFGRAGRSSADYLMAGVHDLARLARQARARLWSRGARATYIMVAVALLATGAVAITTFTGATLALYSHDLSSPAAIIAKKKTGITLLDRNGQVLYQSYGAQSDTLTPLSQIPQTLKDATLAAEDPSFYDHQGFSWRATARAVWVDLTQRDKAQGGSTLTQQLVKNALLTSTKTYERKYQEVVLATALEQRYSKDQILEMYLNETDYGQDSRGVAAAAETYFHKPVQQLDLAQAAMIAGLPLGTNRFDPNADPGAATDRRNYVLDRMAQLGKITNTQARAAEAEPLVAYPKTVTIQAPHFVFYVLNQLKALYGEQAVENNGMTVRTTLDLTKQNAAQQIVQNQIARLAPHHVSNGGLVSLEPGTGDIISMVGSVDYNAPGFGAVNVVTSKLQPGSSFKPFAYVTAFEKGWNGSTQVQDEPIALPNGDGTMYVPQDYDGRWRGNVTLRRALANSLNIPAIHVLQYAGIPDTLKTATDMGVTGLGDPSQYGLSVVLGAADVMPIDMATAYAAFANNGTKVAPRAILAVTDRYSKDITKHDQPAPKQVLDPKYAYMITSILSDNGARTEEFGANSPLKLSRPDAAKTGTTNDFRDNWTVGYTPNLATAVWVGNNDHSAMTGVDGITGAAPIWHDYMEQALADMPVQDFTMPAGDTATKVCSQDGGLANPWDTNTYTEVFPTDQPLTRQCSSFGFTITQNSDQSQPGNNTALPNWPFINQPPPFYKRLF